MAFGIDNPTKTFLTGNDASCIKVKLLNSKTYSNLLITSKKEKILMFPVFFLFLLLDLHAAHTGRKILNVRDNPEQRGCGEQ